MESSIRFDLPKNRNSIIKVIGVGGGGGNAVNHMFQQGIVGVDFVICNTDTQALEASAIATKLQIGTSITGGLGAGANPEIGKRAAMESLEEIIELLGVNTKMLFVTAGMGGGTGTGAAPIIAKAAKELGILTVAIVTTPFRVEGGRRKTYAEEGIRQLKESVDCLLVINNDRIMGLHGNLGVQTAFAHANDILTTAAKGIAEIITLPGIVNVDFEDVRTVMHDSGVALMGAASAQGEHRAIQAIQQAMNSPLLNNSKIRGAKNILLNIVSGTQEALMSEIEEIMTYVQAEAEITTDIIFGLSHNEALGDSISVTIIATGFEQPENKPLDPSQLPQRFVLETRQEKSEEEITPGNPEPVAVKPSEDSPEKPTPTTPPPPVAKTPEPAPRMQLDAAERFERTKTKLLELRRLNERLHAPGGLEEMEREPAYRRMGVTFDQVTPSDEEVRSRISLEEDAEQPKRTEFRTNNNGYLHDQPD